MRFLLEKSKDKVTSQSEESNEISDQAAEP